MRAWIALLLLMPCAAIADRPYQYVPGDDGLSYLLRLPAGYEQQAEKYPLLMFLHGIGEKGNGSEKAIEKVAIHGPFRSMREGHWDASLPLIVVGPQFGGLRFGWPVGKLLALLDQLQERYRVDPARVYVTGLSLGGHAVWKLVEQAPSRIAAVVPAGGWADDLMDDCMAISHIGAWAFHGENDGLVKPAKGLQPIETMNTCEPPIRVPARMTILADTEHGNWELVYDNRHEDHHVGADGREYSDIYRWLLSFSLQRIQFTNE